MNIWQRLQNIDPRLLYLLLIIVVGMPLIVPVPVPAPAISPQTQSAYDTIERIAADPVLSKKMVILSCNFAAGTATENRTQCEVIMRHLMKRKLKFAIFAFADPQGRELGQQTANSLQAQYGYVYGRDYVNWGFRPGGAIVNILKAAVRDIPTAIGTDYTQTKLTEIPVMQGIQTVNDIGAIVEISGSNILPVWLSYFQRTGTEPIATLFCPTAVMAPEAYPFLKSGQLQGMLTGLAGAIEYEVLLREPGFASRASASLSYSHFLIIFLVIIGNIGMIITRRQQQREAATTTAAAER